MYKKVLPWRLFSHVAALVAACLSLAAPVAAAPQDQPLRVVASFSVLGDMVSQIGGDFIQLTTIVGPGGDVHSFEPRPSDAKALSEAQLLIVNGLGFEGWLPRLVQASGFKGVEVVASRGIAPRALSPEEAAAHSDEHAHKPGKNGGEGGQGNGAQPAQAGAVDPHAWQSLNNGIIYARNIASALIKADPAHAEGYRSRTEYYISEMKKLDAELRQVLQTIPEDKRKVVTSHDAFGYFARDYGVRFISALGISSDAEPSAKEIAGLIALIKQEGSPPVFLEKSTNSRLIKEVARQTGSQIGGTLYSDSLSAPDQPAGTYLGMIKWNAGQLLYALRPKENSQAH